MRAASTTRPARALLVLAAVAGLALTTGCDTLNNTQRVIGRADLVNDLATRMDRATALTYVAEYQLAGGKTATIAQAQQPPRAAYTYPGGRVTVTGDAIAECADAGSRITCTLTPPPTVAARPAASLFNDAGRHGLVAPSVVIGLLTAAALDADAVIQQHDTTVAGQHATCVTVERVENAPAANFDACVTADGVLGSFRGVVNGSAREITLTNYRESVDAHAFELPGGATIVDRRPGSK
ncbi:MAG TPA: hypothetical protein VGJ63_03695 [Micromonosporaceae bacterium]